MQVNIEILKFPAIEITLFVFYFHDPSIAKTKFITIWGYGTFPLKRLIRLDTLNRNIQQGV